MKTVIIFDQLLEKPISFRVVEGDYSHLNNKYVNHFELDEIEEQEIMCLLYKNDEGDLFDDFTQTFPANQIDDQTVAIVVGFLP